MSFFDATILGIIEGLTEFLPISSTAHLILGAKILNLEQSDFVKSFEIIIQLGAILAVVTLYFKSFFSIDILKKVIVGFLPTAVIGLLVYKRVKEYLGDISVVLWSLFIGGIFLIIFELYYHKKNKVEKSKETMTIGQCVIIGLCQCFAFVPGVSRSASTIVGGMMLGVSRKTIAEYSFLLAVPTMASATTLDILKNKDILIHSSNILNLIVGFIVSYVVAILAIKWLIAYVKKRDFIIFGIYRIIVAVIFFAFVI
jgi:undecaprenyl-diphosphatase